MALDTLTMLCHHLLYLLQSICIPLEGCPWPTGQHQSLHICMKTSPGAALQPLLPRVTVADLLAPIRAMLIKVISEAPRTQGAHW